MGMSLMRQIVTRGRLPNPDLADFSGFCTGSTCRLLATAFTWVPIRNRNGVVAPGCIASCAVAAFRSRVTGVYLSIITQALTYALRSASPHHFASAAITDSRFQGVLASTSRTGRHAGRCSPSPA